MLTKNKKKELMIFDDLKIVLSSLSALALLPPVVHAAASVLQSDTSVPLLLEFLCLHHS